MLRAPRHFKRRGRIRARHDREILRAPGCAPDRGRARRTVSPALRPESTPAAWIVRTATPSWLSPTYRQKAKGPSPAEVMALVSADLWLRSATSPVTRRHTNADANKCEANKQGSFGRRMHGLG